MTHERDQDRRFAHRREDPAQERAASHERIAPGKISTSSLMRRPVADRAAASEKMQVLLTKGLGVLDSPDELDAVLTQMEEVVAPFAPKIDPQLAQELVRGRRIHLMPGTKLAPGRISLSGLMSKPETRAEHEAARERYGAGCHDDILLRIPENVAPGRMTFSSQLRRPTNPTSSGLDRPLAPPAQKSDAEQQGAAERTVQKPIAAAEEKPAASEHLPAPVLDRMERRFGTTFARIKLHTASPKVTGATKALAHDNEVHFAAGAYQPDTGDGERILAHELAHLVQLRGTGKPGTREQLEAEADHAALQVARGEGVQIELSAPGGVYAYTEGASGTSSPAPKGPGPQTAAVYFADNQAQFLAALRRRLASAKIPPPHARLIWAGAGEVLASAFERALTRVCGADMDLAHALRDLLHPVDPLQVIDQHRDLTSGRPGEQVDGRPALGPTDWNPIAGQALALEIEAALRASLPRMGLRYVAQGDEYHGSVSPELLVTSCPCDRVTAQLLCDPLATRFDPGPAHAAKRRDLDPPAAFRNGIQPVRLEWMVDRDAELWNWVRVVQPASARPEDVAAAVFERRDGQRHTEYAHSLIAAPPYYQIPPALARKLPNLARHAPAEDRHRDAGAKARSALALADSPLGDDAARAQAGRGSAKVDIAGLAHTLDTSLAQLRYAADLLDPWGLGHCAGPAIRWITRHQDVVRAAPTETLRVWTAIAAGQSAILRSALGDLLELDGLTRSAQIQPGTPDARPFHDVIEALGVAMGESHLAQAATAQLAVARAQKARLPLVLLDRTLRASREAAQELAGSASGGTGPDAHALASVQTLEAGALQLREHAMVSGTLDVSALEALTVAASEQTLRTRLLTLHGKLGQLLDASGDATDGFFGHVGNVSGDIWALRTELATLRPRVWSILETMQRQAIPAPPLPQEPAQAQETFARARKEAVAHTQASLAELTSDGKLHALFQRAVESIPAAARNSARFQLAVQVAALIGVSVLGGVAGAMAGSVVRGALLADVAVDSVAFARGAAMARWAGATANVVTDAAVQSVGQTAMFGGNTKLTFIENLATNVLVLGAIRPLHTLTSEIGKLDRSATGLWKVLSGGKVALVEGAKLTVETLAVAGAAYAVTRLVEGKPPPSDDVLVSWAVQGASMAVGKFIHGQLQGMTERWGAALEARMHLIKRGGALKELAQSVEGSGSPDAAVTLMAGHMKLLHDEHALLQGAGAGARLGLDERQLATLRASNLAALADTKSPAFTFTWLRAFGLSPVADNGLVWSGTHQHIVAALADLGAPLTPIEHAQGPRWTAELNGHEVTFLAVGDAPQDQRASVLEQGGTGAAGLSDLLPHDLRDLSITRSAELHGTEVRVRYRNGAVQIEAGPQATARHIAYHAATVRRLRRFEGPLGFARRLVDSVRTKLRLTPGYGTAGFEARAEIVKLREIESELVVLRSQIEEGNPLASNHQIDTGAVDNELARVQEQLEDEAARVDSYEPGKGFVAARDLPVYPISLNSIKQVVREGPGVFEVEFKSRTKDGNEIDLGTADIALTEEGVPDEQSAFVIKNYVHYAGKEYKAKLYQAVIEQKNTQVPLPVGECTPLTRYIIRAFIERFKGRFGHEPEALGGSLAWENKKNFWREFINLVRGGMSRRDALQAAASRISYGAHRIDAGYSRLEVKTEDRRYWKMWDLKDGKLPMAVPQQITIIGRKP